MTMEINARVVVNSICIFNVFQHTLYIQTHDDGNDVINILKEVHTARFLPYLNY